MTDKLEQRKTEMVDAAESLGISQEEYEKIVDECIFGKEEPVSDNLDEEIRQQHRCFREINMLVFEDIARHFANWQKQQMMKDIIVGTIHGNSWLDNRVIKADVPEEMKDKVGYYGDKVKLIIIKED